ncbi:MAG: quinoprotein dehydrogenase-associated SoxYZ-like carrier [Pseudomonadota bacterium]
MPRTTLCLAAVLALVATAPLAGPVKNPMKAGETWTDLQYDVVGDAALRDGAALLELEAPVRAHDAATVPIILRQLDTGAEITAATVVIDENPAPVAAVMGFGPGMAPLDFEMRVRVDQYSNVRVIAETGDGLHMTGRFVKASGGCSAPASRDPEVALAGMGEMRLRQFTDASAPLMSTPRREAQIMIRHPNYSGLQRDQITHLFIPAHFIDHMEVWQGDELLFTMDGGISVSENPVFRFVYSDNGAPDLRVMATDTDGNRFESVLPKSVGL